MSETELAEGYGPQTLTWAPSKALVSILAGSSLPKELFGDYFQDVDKRLNLFVTRSK